jgi:hypothetical protein
MSEDETLEVCDVDNWEFRPVAGLGETGEVPVTPPPLADEAEPAEGSWDDGDEEEEDENGANGCRIEDESLWFREEACLGAPRPVTKEASVSPDTDRSLPTTLCPSTWLRGWRFAETGEESPAMLMRRSRADGELE